jgi:hypothetical protein
MNTFSLARLVTFLLAVSSVASAAKSSSSKSSQNILATPVSISKSSKGSDMPSNKSGKKNKTNKGSDMQRLTLQARTTLVNVDLDELSPAECIFFEDTWMAAYKTVHANNDIDGNGLEIRSVVVEDNSNNADAAGGPTDNYHPGNRNHGRQLRGGANDEHRSLFYIFKPPTFYFDIWTLIELSCLFCKQDDVSYGQDDDDDDFYGYKEPGTQEPGTRHLDLEDDEELENKLEILLCEMLREGPFESFQEAEGCQVTYVSA